MFLSKTFSISCVVSFICLLAGWRPNRNLAYIKRPKTQYKTFPRLLCSIRIVLYFLQDVRKLTRLFWRNSQPEACLLKIRTTKEQSAYAIRTRHVTKKIAAKPKYFLFLLILLFGQLLKVFENRRKCLIQRCERSELHLYFEWPKVH